ncbi:rRNA (cytosine-C5-)-methyltransferase nop2 [Ascosphaera aggregata]|nr:rRNA (cytosine-C5-)-methyltransferase nop2 [Ascosphaera aggregata]
MGVGRRMKKQGMPEPLDESKISSLKRSKPGDSREAASSASVNKKRRTEIKPAKPNVKAAKSTIADEKKQKGKPSAKRQARKPVKTKEESESEDESLVGSDDDMDELPADEFGDWEDVSSEDELEKDGEGFESEMTSGDSAFDSEEEEGPRQHMFSDDEDESDAEEKLTAANIEGLSRKLDMQAAEEMEQARLEMEEAAMQTNIAGDALDVLQDGERMTGLAPDLKLLRTRINETIRILDDLKTLGQPDKSRADYMKLLLDDFCAYYGYTPYLAEKLMNLFTPREAFAFFEANETPRPVVIRTNTLRTNRRTLAQALINRGVVLEPVGKWSKVGLQVFESAVPLGATPEYLAGHYILQAASSFLPVMALAPQPHERILDMAAAPGGKTTYISALMRNTGCVIANDASKPRAKGLIGNIHRLGCKNTIVTNLDARTAFPKAMGGFDRVLLDAPCAGTGVISKDSSVKTSKTERDFLALPHMQKQLLLAAIDSVDHTSKGGGYVVYSTCSVTVEENEGVVQYALRKRPNVKIVDTGLGSFGSEGFRSYMGKNFDDKMNLTRRYFPHRENVDGFFVCKLKKFGPSPADVKKPAGTAAPADETQEDSQDIIDKTPIRDETDKAEDDPGFGPFDEDEDQKYIERARRAQLRKKGLDPRALEHKKGKKEKKEKKDDKQARDNDEAVVEKSRKQENKENAESKKKVKKTEKK